MVATNPLVCRSKAFVCSHDLHIDCPSCAERAAIGPVGIDAIDQVRAGDALLRLADDVPDTKLQRRQMDRGLLLDLASAVAARTNDYPRSARETPRPNSGVGAIASFGSINAHM